MKKTTITTDEWLVALEKAYRAQGGPEGMSARQIGEAVGKCVEITRKIIRRGIEAGILEYAGSRREPNIANRMSPVPLYRVKEKHPASASRSDR